MALGNHFLASHNINDIEEHLAISTRSLFNSLRPIAALDDAQVPMQVAAKEIANHKYISDLVSEDVLLSPSLSP